jgi:hypothetical protein
LARLNIPLFYRSAIAILHSLSDSEFDELMLALEKVEPGLVNRDVLASVAAAARDIKQEDVERIFQSVMALHMARSASETPVEQFCEEIADELHQAGPERLKLNEVERERFVRRLRKIFSFDSLAVAAKSRDLQTDHDHVYLNSRVVTDIRAVFRAAPDESPVGMVLVHMLRLGYLDRGKDGERANIYMALDDADLANLKKVLERAELKAKTLRAKLQSAGMRPLSDTTRSSASFSVAGQP